MSTITKEQVQKIIDAADEVITALAGTNEDVNPESDNMIRLWDDLNDRYAPPEVVRELARRVLASLEAEKSILYRERNPYNGLTTGWQELTGDEYEFIKDNAGENAEFRTVYTAPPAPASSEPVAWLWSHRKHPSEVTLVRPEDDERAEGALWSGWHCQPLSAQVMSEHQPSTSPQQEIMAKPKK